MKLETIYVWKTLDEYGEIVLWGCTDESVDQFIERFIPGHDSCCDRNLSEVQEYIDMYHEGKYKFVYKEIEIDLDDIVEESE